MKTLLLTAFASLLIPQLTFAEEPPVLMPKELKCDLEIGDEGHRSVTTFDENGYAWYTDTIEDFELSAFATGGQIGILSITNPKMGIDVMYVGKNNGLAALNVNGAKISFACTLY